MCLTSPPALPRRVSGSCEPQQCPAPHFPISHASSVRPHRRVPRGDSRARGAVPSRCALRAASVALYGTEYVLHGFASMAVAPHATRCTQLGLSGPTLSTCVRVVRFTPRAIVYTACVSSRRLSPRVAHAVGVTCGRFKRLIGTGLAARAGLSLGRVHLLGFSQAKRPSVGLLPCP